MPLRALGLVKMWKPPQCPQITCPHPPITQLNCGFIASGSASLCPVRVSFALEVTSLVPSSLTAHCVVRKRQ